MEVSNILPADFDGTFRFTNATDEDFIGQWGSKEYLFPAQTTSPILMTDQTPLEIQQIRKHFAKKLAEREFFKSQSYGRLHAQERNSDGSARLNSIQQAGTYSISDLMPFIQKCLEPLRIAKAIVTEIEVKPLEDMLSRNEEGQLNSQVLDKKISLKEKALKG